MSLEFWRYCVDSLRAELTAQQFNTWIRPLQVEGNVRELRIYAPNRFVMDWVSDKFLPRLTELLAKQFVGKTPPTLSLHIGSHKKKSLNLFNEINSDEHQNAHEPTKKVLTMTSVASALKSQVVAPKHQVDNLLKHTSYLNRFLHLIIL